MSNDEFSNGDTVTGQGVSSDPVAIPVVAQVQVNYSAPLPPPVMLAEYERILPGAADRIFAQWENETRHRQDIERTCVTEDSKHQSVGQHYAFILSIAVIIGSLVLIWQGKSLVGLVLIIATLAVLAGLFVYGRRSSEKGQAETTRILADALREVSSLEGKPTQD